MPSHFDRFRLLNGGSRFSNESDKFVYIKAQEEDPAIEVLPGHEVDLPYSPAGEVIIDIKTEQEP